MRRYMARTLALALAFALAFALLPAGALAAEGDTFIAENSERVEIRYQVINENPKEVAVIAKEGGDKYKDDVAIPEMIEATPGNAASQYTVTAIGDSAFADCDKLTSIDLPNGVTAIGTSAFARCSALTSINIPASVKTIGASAFFNCGLIRIDLPNGVTTIDPYAFAQCTVLTSITLPNSVTAIGVEAFASTGLTSVILPPKITAIPSGMFKLCSNLPSVKIPVGVTSIGDGAFYSCTSLTSIEVPAGVTAIGTNAFEDCANLTSVEIPDSLTFNIGDNDMHENAIGGNAFDLCDKLAGVTLSVSRDTTIDSDHSYELASGSQVEVTKVELPNDKTFNKIHILPGGRVTNGTGGDLEHVQIGRQVEGKIVYGSEFTLHNEASYPIGPAENKATILTPGASFPQGTEVAFSAEGAGMGKANPQKGDTRYLPKSWSVNPSGYFPAAGPYEGKFSTSGLAVGDYTLTVKFLLQAYDGTNWQDQAGWEETVETAFKVTEAPPAPPTPPTSTGSGSYGPALYSLRVEGGTGTGSYPAGRVVTIRADEGAPFAQWRLVSGEGTIADPFSRETTFTMGAGGAVVAALQAAPPKTGDGPANWLGLGLLLAGAAGFSKKRLRHVFR